MQYYEPDNHDPDVDTIRRRLEAGKPVNLKTEIGNRALCEAAEHGNLEFMTLLLDNGADPNGYFDPVETRERHLQLLPDDAAYLPSDASDRNDDEGETTQCLTDMLNEIPIDMENMERAWAQQLTSAPCGFEIPLFMAAQSGSVNCVLLLINRGIDVNQRDNSNQNALWYATNEEVINLFLKQGLNIEDHDWVGYTPLRSAISEGPDAIPQIRALIASGADVNATHDRGFTVFMSAVGCMERDRRVLEIIVEAGADPLAVSELGWNAFHAAIDVDGAVNDEESVRSVLGYLHELGININHKNNGGVSPLGIAIEMGHTIEAQVLCELGADVNAIEPRVIYSGGKYEKILDPLIFMTIANSLYPVEKLQILLNHSVHLNVVDEQGRSPIEFTRACLANLDPQDKDKYTQKNIKELKQCIQLLEHATAHNS